jgi:hypothetical protein
MPSKTSTRTGKERQAERQLDELIGQMDDLKEEKEELKEQMKFIRTSMVDINKLSFEAMKHLTTLSAGSILLLVAFLEKLFINRREWSAFVGIAMVLFIVSIIAAMYALMQSSMVITKFVVDEDDTRRTVKKVATEFLAFFAFILGIISLAVFVLKNFYG